jgi:leader peptidase (prepilin peptidase)/N-methyltransferase
MFPGIFISGVVGWLAGVGVNWLSDCLPSERRLSPSLCRYCTAPRSVRDTSGILAKILRRSECPYCGRVRGWRPVAVELAGAGGLVAILFWASSSLEFFATSTIYFILLLILVIDIEHRLILHVVTIPAMAAAFILSSLDPGIGYKRSLIGGLAGFLFFILLYMLGGLFSWWIARRRGEALSEVAFGFGDVTLATLIGLMIGFPGVIEALLRGILLAGAFSIIYMVVLAARRRYSAFEAIPYGPFLILGCLYVVFFGSTMLQRLIGL